MKEYEHLQFLKVKSSPLTSVLLELPLLVKSSLRFARTFILVEVIGYSSQPYKAENRWQ
jgi:hypothetical protein